MIREAEKLEATPIREQMADLLKLVEESIGDEMVLASVVVVRTQRRTYTFKTTESMFYELLGLLEVGKADLVYDANAQAYGT